MRCPVCGNENVENAKFCKSCGALIPNMQAQNISMHQQEYGIQGKAAKKGKGVLCFFLGILLSVVLVVVSILTGVLKVNKNTSGKKIIESETSESDTSRKAEGDGYDTAEEAVLAYVEAMREQDIDKMISTFAIETYVENFDVERYFDSVGSYNGPYVDSCQIPCTGMWSTELNENRRESEVSEYIMRQYITLTMGDYYEEYWERSGQPYNKSSEAELKELFDSLSEEPNFSNIEIGDFVTMKELKKVDERIGGDAYNQNIEEMIKREGYDERETFILELTIDGEPCLLGMDVVCYNGKWYNLGPGVLTFFLGFDIYWGGLYRGEMSDFY